MNRIVSWCFEDGWYHIRVTVTYPGDEHIGPWCKENFGYYCSIVDIDTFDLAVYFCNHEHATMFRLAFGGVYEYDEIDQDKNT